MREDLQFRTPSLELLKVTVTSRGGKSYASRLAQVSDCWLGGPPRGEGEGNAQALLHDEAKGGRRTRYLFQQNPGGGVEVGVEALTGSLPS